MPYTGQAVDYEKIRQFVLQVIREHDSQETQEMLYKDRAVEQAESDSAEENVGIAFGFDENTINGIMSSLEAFRG